MAQILQPSGSSIGGSTPTKVGAVVFDKPTYDPIAIQMKTMGDLDNWAAQKQKEQAEAKKVTDALVADLDFDAKGIYDRDEDYFKQGRVKLVDAQTELSKYDPSSPEWKKAFNEAEKTKRMYATEVEASVNQKDAIAKYIQQFKEGDYDAKVFNEWLAGIRTAANPIERQQWLNKNPLVKPRQNLEDLTLAKIDAAKKGGVIAPIKSNREYGKTPSGEDIMIEQEELFPEEKRVAIAADWISNDNGIKDAVFEQFKSVPQAEIDFYTSKAEELSKKYNRTFKPYDIWYSDRIEKYDVPTETAVQLGYTPERTQAAQWAYGEGMKLKQQGAGLLEQISGAFMGKPEYLQPFKSTTGMEAVGVKGLSGYRLGEFQYPDEKGAIQTAPNNILEVVRTRDGRLRVMTTKTLYSEKARTTDPKTKQPIAGAKYDSNKLYITYDNVTQLFNDIATGHFGKDGGELIKKGAIDYATTLGGYDDATAFKADKIVKMSPIDVERRNTIFQYQVQPTTGAVQQQPVQQQTPPKQDTKKAEDLRKKYNY